MKKNETEKEYYLDKFKRENKPNELFRNPDIERIGTEIVELFKKEDLTYDQTYASLQFAYNLLKYESNFVRVR